MTTFKILLLLLPLVWLVSGCAGVVYQPNPQNGSSMTFRQAQQQLLQSYQKSEQFTGQDMTKTVQEIKVTPTNFQLKRMPGVGDGSIPTFEYKDMDITNLAVFYDGVVYYTMTFPLRGWTLYGKPSPGWTVHWNSGIDAGACADALNVLITRSKSSTTSDLQKEGGTFVWPPPVGTKPSSANNPSGSQNSQGSPDLSAFAGHYLADGITLMVTISSDGSFTIEGDMEGGKATGRIQNLTAQGFQAVDANGHIIGEYSLTQGNPQSIFGKGSDGKLREFKKF